MRKWILRLLKRLKKSKPYSPKSTWPDIIDPFQYQNKLMREAEPTNTENCRKLLEQIRTGQKIECQTTSIGPYTTYVVYHLTNGEEFKMTYRSSLHWVEPMMKI